MINQSKSEVLKEEKDKLVLLAAIKQLSTEIANLKNDILEKEELLKKLNEQINNN